MDQPIQSPVMKPVFSKGSVETELRQRLDSFAQNIRQGRQQEIMSFYTDDIIAFDMMPPLRFEDKRKYGSEAWQECFTGYFRFPVQYDYQDLKVIVRDDLVLFLD